MKATQERGQQGRPSTDAVLDPQAAKEARIREVFTGQKKLLAQLFPKDGETLVARAVSSAIMASRELDKDGKYRLANVSAEAICEKVIAAHHMGLEPGTECYLVPYGGKLQLQTGPLGLVRLMMNSGFVASIEYHDVFGFPDPETGKPTDPGGDFFQYDLGDAPFIRHRKGVEGRRRLGISHVYGIIRTTTGGVIREVLTYEDVEYYRAKSKRPDGEAWRDNWAGMARKTLLHRMADLVPRSPMLSAALREESGGIEVPEEILAAVRARMAAEMAGNGGATQPETVPAYVPADEGREPGSDDR